MPDTRPDETRAYPADKARGGEIIPRKPWHKIVFFGALAAAVLFGFLFSL